MKIILCLMISASLLPDLIAQQKGPVISAYAYWRESIPGTIPNSADEEGNIIKREERSKGSWFIFIEYKNKQTIKPVQVLTNGRSSKVRYESVSQLPVLHKRPGLGNNVETDTLVLKTNYQVMQVHLQGESNLVHLTNDTTDKDKLVIYYYWKGKRYSYTIREIKNLPPIVLQ